MAEPAPGFAFDIPVLVLAGAGITAVVASLSWWPAWSAARAASAALRTGEQNRLGRRSVVARSLARAGLPVTLTAARSDPCEPDRWPAAARPGRCGL
jgi:hypothetical protein